MVDTVATRVCFVSGNPDKIREVTATLPGIVPVEVELPPELQAEPDVIVRAKCEAALVAAPPGPDIVLVEDTSLGLHSLHGMPGPYVKWFQQSVDDDTLFTMVEAFPDRRATVACVFAIGRRHADGSVADITLVRGEVEGVIVRPRGTHGFGWDRVFVPTGPGDGEDGCERDDAGTDVVGAPGDNRESTNTLTFAEMTLPQKNRFSHRARALRRVRAHLETLGVRVPVSPGFL